MKKVIKIIKIFQIYIYLFLIIVLCCTNCHYMNLHKNHKIIKIDDEEELKKENISFNN